MEEPCDYESGGDIRLRVLSCLVYAGCCIGPTDFFIFNVYRLGIIRNRSAVIPDLQLLFYSWDGLVFRLGVHINGKVWACCRRFLSDFSTFP